MWGGGQARNPWIDSQVFCHCAKSSLCVSQFWISYIVAKALNLFLTTWICCWQGSSPDSIVSVLIHLWAWKYEQQLGYLADADLDRNVWTFTYVAFVITFCEIVPSICETVLHQGTSVKMNMETHVDCPCTHLYYLFQNIFYTMYNILWLCLMWDNYLMIWTNCLRNVVTHQGFMPITYVNISS